MARSRGSGVRHSTHITSSVSAPRAHRPNATQGGATPASSATLISAKLEPQTAERSTKPGSQARDERACERVIGTALASGRDRRRTPVVGPTGPAAGGPVGGGPRGRRGHLGPGRDGRRGARSGAAVRVVDGGGRRRLYPRPGDGPARPPPRLRRGPRAPAAAGHRGRATARDRRRPRPRAVLGAARCRRARLRRRHRAGVRAVPDRPPVRGRAVPARLRRRGAAAPVAAMGTDAARRGRHVGGAAAAAHDAGDWRAGALVPGRGAAELRGRGTARGTLVARRPSAAAVQQAVDPDGMFARTRCPDRPDSLHGRRAGTVGARVVRAVASPAGAGRPAAAARPARSHRCRAPRPSARCR